MNTRHFLNPERVRKTKKKDRPNALDRASNGRRIARRALATVALTVGLPRSALLPGRRRRDDLAKQYKIETWSRRCRPRTLRPLRPALRQRQIDDRRQMRSRSSTTLRATLKNFPEWHLRIVGHTDATADPVHNEHLSYERANAIKAALVERGIEEPRLATAGAGETRPVATNDTPEGRALNRRVELIRFTDSAAAKQLLKAMSEYMAKQQAISFDYDATLEVVTNDKQKLALASSGAVTLNRPDKIRAIRAGGFVDVETLFDGKTLTLLGKNANKYTQLEVPGTVEQLIDELRDKYDRPLPAADLLTSDAYSALMEDVYDSKDLGSGVINGVECDFLAFRKDDVDLQMWIAQGDQPSPCKYVITSRLVADGPQYTVEFTNWKTGDEAVKDDFVFQERNERREDRPERPAGQDQ